MRNRNWLKILGVLVAVFFMAAPAMAANVTSTAAWMAAHSECDQAGSFQVTFTPSDVDAIQAQIGTIGYALIKVSLSGTDVSTDAEIPTLCNSIRGTADPGAPVPNTGNLYAIDEIGVEVSDVTGFIGADVTAYAYGANTNQFFYIYITGIQDSQTPADSGTWPWISLGVYSQDPGPPVIDADSSICARVVDYSGIAKLLAVFDVSDNIFQIGTGSTIIGQFINQDVNIRGCGKDDVSCSDTSTIQLCPVPDQGNCPSGGICFVAEGNYPTTGEIEFYIRTNGQENGDDTQKGVYITGVNLYVEGSTSPIDPLFIDEDTQFEYKADGSDADNTGDCDFEVKQYRFKLNASVLSEGKLQFCISYDVDPETAQVGTDARFWVEASTIPCGVVIEPGTIVPGASLVSCGSEVNYRMYFPYVLTQSTPWGTGIAITNMDSNPTISEMVCTFTLTDSTGTSFTYIKSDFNSTVWTFMLDSIVSEFDGTPAPGPAWLGVVTNFPVDGYEFLSDGNFGAGTLPRFHRD